MFHSSGNKDTKLYDTLGIPSTSSIPDIKKAYRKLAMKYHPDKQTSKSIEEKKKAEERFKEICQAYDILGDEKKKENYDRFGLSSGGNYFNMHEGGLHDMMKTFFDVDHRPRRVRIGRSRSMNVFVTLEEIYKETGKLIELTRYTKCSDCNGIGGKCKETCSICNGKGSILKIQQLAPGFVQQSQQTCHKCEGVGNVIKAENMCNTCNGTAKGQVTKKLKINLTKKTRDGEQIRIEGYSDYEPNVDKQGDFLFMIRIKENSKYKLNGNNLCYRELITLEEALCGLSREIILPNGEKHRYSINEVIHPRDIYILKEYGLKDKHNKLGDIEIEFIISFPKKIDNERKLYLQKLLKKYNPLKEVVDNSLEEISLLKIDSQRESYTTAENQPEPMLNEDPLFNHMEGATQCHQQ